MDTLMPGEIEAFNGAKFISVVACQLIHFTGLSNNNGWNNLEEAHFLHTMLTHGAFYYIQLYLQSVVAMSGAGITISTLYRIQKKGEGFSLLPFYLRRIWRLGVPYFITIALIIGVVPYIGSGPKWPDVLSTVEICQDYWWANVFFINNYFCLPLCEFHTWYLSADMQLLLIAPILILSFNRSARMGVTCAGLFIIFSVSRIFYHAYFESLNAWDVIAAVDTAVTTRYFTDVYFLPFARVGCYSMGVATGYLIHVHGKEIPLSKIHHRWIAPIAATVALAPFLLCFRYVSGYFPDPTHLEVALCEALSRILFTSFSAYICIAIYTGCQDGVTRVFRAIFCQKLYVFTSKVHYSVFLIHVIITEIFLGTRPQPMEYSIFQLLKYVVGLLAVTHLVAIPFTLLFVFPFARLEKVLEKRWKMEKKNKEIKQS